MIDYLDKSVYIEKCFYTLNPEAKWQSAFVRYPTTIF